MLQHPPCSTISSDRSTGVHVLVVNLGLTGGAAREELENRSKELQKEPKTRSSMEGMSLFEDATSTWLRAKILPAASPSPGLGADGSSLGHAIDKLRAIGCPNPVCRGAASNAHVSNGAPTLSRRGSQRP